MAVETDADADESDGDDPSEWVPLDKFDGAKPTAWTKIVDKPYFDRPAVTIAVGNKATNPTNEVALSGEEFEKVVAAYEQEQP